MIAKHVPMKAIKKSDFAALVNYLLNEQQKNERVGYVSVENCHAGRSDAAILEVLNTQDQNTRAGSDKTYHLIISFPANEQPDDAILQAIEARICKGLGYGEHQRISVVHHDTDNLHIHIAINKIHPTRYTLHDPYYDHKILSKLCEKLEREYGLTRVNHQAKKCAAENKADDMECHAGVESLLGWIKRECLSQIQTADSWEKLHQVMLDNGLEIRERGNGLIITDQNGLTVKASSVARELSKNKLEARLGAFVPSPERLAIQAKKSSKRYALRPVRSRVDTVELYAQYMAEKNILSSTWMIESTQARARKNQLIEAAKRFGRLKRAVIKLMGDSRLNKKILYALTSKALQEKIQAINQQYRKEQQAIRDKYRSQAWADWLRRKATDGDAEALMVLRARDAAQGLKGNTIAAYGGQRSVQKIGAWQDSITKEGTVIYRVGASAIRDDGDKLKVSRGTTKEGLEAALCMAMERYGDRITVNGTDEFKEQIVQVAALARLAITFDDADLESRRQSISNKAFMSSHVSEPMQQGLQPDDKLRQDFHRTGVTAKAHAAAEKYIAEREQKRLNIFDISKYRHYNAADAGTVSFMGLRQIDDQSLALLKRNDEIIVLPIDAATVRRMKRLVVGDLVSVTSKGSIKMKGIRR